MSPPSRHFDRSATGAGETGLGLRSAVRRCLRSPVRAAPAPSAERGAESVRRFARSRSGVAAVEFALVALPFFAILFSLVETGMVFIGDTTLQNAVKRAAREVRTGQAADQGFDLAAFRTALCKNSIMFDCAKFKIDLKSYAKYSDIPLVVPFKNGKLDESGFGYSAGGADQIMALRVYYEWPVFTDVMSKSFSNLKSGNYLMAATTAFKTEPFQ